MSEALDLFRDAVACFVDAVKQCRDASTSVLDPAAYTRGLEAAVQRTHETWATVEATAKEAAAKIAIGHGLGEGSDSPADGLLANLHDESRQVAGIHAELIQVLLNLGFSRKTSSQCPSLDIRPRTPGDVEDRVVRATDSFQRVEIRLSLLGPRTALPVLDRKKKQLRFKDTVVWGYKKSSSQLTLVERFADRGWPREITIDDWTPDKIKEVLSNLKRGIIPGAPIGFSQSHRTVSWRPLDAGQTG